MSQSVLSPRAAALRRPAAALLILAIGAAASLGAPGCGAHTPAPAGDARAAPDAAAASAARQYLLFQIFTYNPAPRTIVDRASLDSAVREIVSTIGGPHRDGHGRQLGFVVGPLTFDHTDDELRTAIQDAFAVAEDNDVAVGFHIDDSMFWNRRQDLWSNSDNVEWSDWQGTVIPHRIIGWVANGMPILPPPMCFNSPAIEAEATRLARDVIGAEIEKGVRHLEAIGKPELFAGVIAGWETRMQDDSGMNGTPVYDGYCALSNLGYSADNPPADQDQALVGVVSDWITLWDQGLEAAGISRDRVFTHIGFAGNPPPDFPFPDTLRDFYKDSPAQVTAFNDDSHPGFSVYGVGMFDALHQVLAQHPDEPWGISEGTAVSLSDALGGGGGGGEPDAGPGQADAGAAGSGMEAYLAGAFNHGARYVDVFGWGDHGSAFDQATTGPDALAAYRSFLAGEALDE